MAILATSSSLLLTSYPSASTSTSTSTSSSGARSLPLPPRLSLSALSSSTTLSSLFSISPTSLAYSTSSRRVLTCISAFSVVKASAAEKKKVLIVNANSGGHAVIGFYFAKQLLGSGHEVTIFTVGEESSDKMKKPPFNRFSVKSVILSLFHFSTLVFPLLSSHHFSSGRFSGIFGSGQLLNLSVSTYLTFR